MNSLVLYALALGLSACCQATCHSSSQSPQSEKPSRHKQDSEIPRLVGRLHSGGSNTRGHEAASGTMGSEVAIRNPSKFQTVGEDQQPVTLSTSDNRIREWILTAFPLAAGILGFLLVFAVLVKVSRYKTMPRPPLWLLIASLPIGLLAGLGQQITLSALSLPLTDVEVRVLDRPNVTGSTGGDKIRQPHRWT